MGIRLQEKYKGIDCDYWKIGAIHYDDATDDLKVDVWLHQSKEVRDADEKGSRLKREVVHLSKVWDYVLEEGLPAGTKLRDAVDAILYGFVMASKPHIEIDPITEEETTTETNKFALGEVC